MRRLIAVFALVSSAVLLVGCAPAPTPTATPDVTEPEYCARMVTNSGGLDDRSFNQSTWEGLQEAATKYNIDTDAIVSTAETDLAPNVSQAVATGCQFVLTVGFELADATLAEATKNPDVHFAIVDEFVDAPNVKPIVFDTAQASFLAGYLAAGVTKTGKVGTFGGGNQPPVTLFMDGFVDGVAMYNDKHETTVEVLGWNKDTQDGSFTGDFEDVNKGKSLTQTLIDQGADIILPVAGQVGQGAAAAAIENPGVSIIWVDSDGYVTLPAQFQSVVLTSVLKNTSAAVVETIGADLEGSFDNEAFVGTLKNGGVEIADFHDQSALVSAELVDELEQIRAAIIAGIITVTGPSSPQ
ncbi:BMP family ABC transporter substrate-binding protein [Cryobacterium levicorallinum]|uniref:BMP family ABC transporter substrate-binding protein n=1 Tax=Cryobacterium levicorallinum TaxID=995038 RepID=A0A1I2ZPF4_9MICO|nr:BMP family ABC transporter substrate-binding protein [Cryobacterium levicorallinum]TFB89622.1 BMP family ABC transporter substrate-binding protein [Cryobacterium levicorallinum]GEP25975.1 BMP family ABC transporter substrate-binding protein [Cryobacterium levicorallinum]SFH39634.1 basic membrane protein A [Cryobacterium levicorallinum]